MKLGVQKLQEWLDKSGKKSSHFAADLGLWPSTLSRILDGSNNPDVETALKIQTTTDNFVQIADWIEPAKKKRP